MPVERLDALYQPLPGEPPGEPVPGGPWGVARRLVEEYRMADPAIVRARWDPGAAFVGRVMVLQLRLWRLLYVHVRVRVTRVWTRTAWSTVAAPGCSGSSTRHCPAIWRSAGWTTRC